jgi:hypothetical protein
LGVIWTVGHSNHSAWLSIVPNTGRVPNPDSARDKAKRQAMLCALKYMGLETDTPMTEL